MTEHPLLTQIITWLIIVVGLGTSWRSLTKQNKDLSDKVDKYAEKQTKCREELPEKYASTKDVSKLFDRVEECEQFISYTKGRTNGTNHVAV